MFVIPDRYYNQTVCVFALKCEEVYSRTSNQIVMDISHERNGRWWWPYLKDVVAVVVLVVAVALARLL